MTGFKGGCKALTRTGAAIAGLACLVLAAGAMPTAAADPVVANVTVTEGNDGTTNATFAITGDPGTKFHYQTADGTATTADADYTATSGDITLDDAGNGSVGVPVAGDSKFEPDETFTLTVTGGDPQVSVSGTGTIGNDDAQPTVALSGDVALAEGNAGATSVPLTVKLSNPSAEAVTVAFSTATGTANANDFDPDPGTDTTLTFNPGQTELPVPVTLQGDTTFEPDEDFTVTIKNPAKATLGSPASSKVTIQNDDPAPTISVAPASFPEFNDDRKQFFDVSLSNPSTQTVGFSFSLVAGTAQTPADFRDGSAVHSMSFAPGVTHVQVPVIIVGDTIDESDEGFTLRLSSPSNGVLAAADNPATIADNDNAAVTIGDITINEPILDPTATAVLVLGLDPAIQRDHPLTVSYATHDGTAVAPGDYTATSGTATIGPNQTSATIPVQVKQDGIKEADQGETFTVTIEGQGGTPVARGTATVTIKEGVDPTISVADLSVSEGAGKAVLPVKLSAATAKTIKVKYTTQNGPAPAAGSPADYADSSGTLTIVPGSLSGTITVPIVDDSASEADERFTIVLSGPENALLDPPGQAVVTIRDNDTSTSGGGGGGGGGNNPPPAPKPVPAPLPPTGTDNPDVQKPGIFLRLKSTTVKISAAAKGTGKGTLGLGCPPDVKIGCRGTLKLEVLVRLTAGKKPKLKKVLVGTGSYALKVKGSGPASIRVTAAGMKLLKQYKRMQVRALFSSRDGQGAPSVTAAIITLDLQKAKPKTTAKKAPVKPKK